MKPKMMRRIAVDLGMTVILLLLMAYELVGQAVHEWLGVGMFLLLVLHHILNGKWSRNMGKGRYTAFRILQTILVFGVLLTMLGSMVSGVILSRHVFSFLPIQGGCSFARSLHMVCGYGGFILMSLHLGIHWTMILGIVKKYRKEDSGSFSWLLRGTAVLIAGYGLYAFVKKRSGVTCC